jgi:tRNA (guanine37-N1)-methyltransferase
MKIPKDIIGKIAILKFKKNTKKSEKIKQAKKILKQKNICTVVEKADKTKGRLRTIRTKFLAGEKTKQTIHKENNCRFKLNTETCYFSPRLSNERKQIASKVKKSDKVLVMFSGINPFGIVIAKLSKAEVVSIELGRECNKYAKINSEINKVQDKITLLQGDVKKIIPKLSKKFSIIVMPRPNLKETFLKQGFQAAKKNTKIYYYCFGKKQDLDKNLKEIKNTAKKHKKKIKILKTKKAGEIAPYEFRWRIDFVIL